MKTKWLVIPLSFGLCCSVAYAQTVKIIPLGSHAGEFCATDRAMLFVDPTGVRILYDVGYSVAGAADPRLGDVHVVLLSHAHGDHIGDRKLAALNAGTCDRPETVPATPNSNTAEIVAAKNAVLLTSNEMGLLLAKKLENIRGAPVVPCAEAGFNRETTVPVTASCLATLELGGKRTIKFSGETRGVEITTLYSAHSNNVRSFFLTGPQGASLLADNLIGYVGPSIGYILSFTNGLKVYLSGDTGLMGDMKTIIHDFYKVNLVVLNIGPAALPVEEAAYAVNTLVEPRAVIPSHANEIATVGGKLQPASRTQAFASLVKGRRVYLPLSGRTMEFDGRADCIAGC